MRESRMELRYDFLGLPRQSDSTRIHGGRVGLVDSARELGLIQSHMAQKPVLRGEVGCACVAREVSVERGGMGERGCARRLGGCEAD